MRLGDLYKDSRGGGDNIFNKSMARVKLRGMEESGVLSFVSLANSLVALEKESNRRIEKAISDFENGDSKSLSGSSLQNIILSRRTRWLNEHYQSLKAVSGNLRRFGEAFEEISNLFITMGEKFGHQTDEDRKKLTMRRQEEVNKLYDLLPQAFRSLGMDRHARAFEEMVNEQSSLLASIGATKTSRNTALGRGKGSLSPEEIEAMQRRDASESGYDDGAELRGAQADVMARMINDQISRLPLNLQPEARRAIEGKGNKAKALELFMRRHNI